MNGLRSRLQLLAAVAGITEAAMSIHGTRFVQKPLAKAAHVPADSEAGRRMTGAFMGNRSNTGKPTQGAKEIARRKRQMEKARA